MALKLTLNASITVQVCKVVSLSTQTITPVYYLIGSPKKFFAYPTFVQTPACGESMTYSFSSPTPYATFDVSLVSVAVEVPAASSNQAVTQTVQMIA